MKKTQRKLLSLIIMVVLMSCSQDVDEYLTIDAIEEPIIEGLNLESLTNVFGENIDLSLLYNYENQTIPNYIRKDNTTRNTITDEQATLGRVLFYDKNLSVNNTISCSSCHQQAFAFGDPDAVSTGVDGLTDRHSMRLINVRFADEDNFFWDERANSLEAQTTQPIQNHVEMGFSGQNGDPGIADLLDKLENLEYYQELFRFAYGDTNITEGRLQESLSQFIRSIQSFDSKYDTGRSMVQNDNRDFPNFTAQENLGKDLFMSPRNQNGANCATCHVSPEFDIDPQSNNNGVVGVFGNPNASDFTITRSPTLRDMVNSQGNLNGPLMHDSSMQSIRDVILHYNSINRNGNPNLDNRLGGRNGQNLNLSNADMQALEAFLETLSGTDVYADSRWSDPFIN